MTRTMCGRILSVAAVCGLTLAMAIADVARADEIGAWQQALPLGGAAPASSPAGGVSIETQLVVSGLASPVKVTHAGDGTNRLFILEQEGFVRIFRNGNLLPFPFLDIESKTSCCGEQGLLGIAFSPNYDVDGLFYVNYTDNSGDSVIAQYEVSPNNPNRAIQNSEVILKVINQEDTNHNGGDLAFGPDGMLYSGIGDGGGSGDPNDRGQNLQFLLGKMLRLDPNNPPTYIPADNPFVGDPMALDEIWSYGVRNPWRFSFDRLTGDMFIADVGQNQIEEVSFQPAASGGGENWGWKVLEGSNCFSDIPAGACDDFLNGGSVLPILEYGHSAGRCSITGGYRYRGSGFPDLEGIYFYGDFCTGEIWGGTETSPGVWTAGSPLLNTALLISSFGEDEAGELYVVDLVGDVHQIVSTAGGGVPCADIQTFQARCVVAGPGNRIQARVVLTDTSHDGESVSIGIDGSSNVVTINGDRANFGVGGATSGAHTVSLDDPAACVADIVVNCP